MSDIVNCIQAISGIVLILIGSFSNNWVNIAVGAIFYIGAEIWSSSRRSR